MWNSNIFNIMVYHTWGSITIYPPLSYPLGSLLVSRVGPDIRIPDIETIRILDILLNYNAGYPVILPDIEHWPATRPDNGYPALEISRISGVRPKKYLAQP